MSKARTGDDLAIRKGDRVMIVAARSGGQLTAWSLRSKHIGRLGIVERVSREDGSALVRVAGRDRCLRVPRENLRRQPASAAPKDAPEPPASPRPSRLIFQLQKTRTLLEKSGATTEEAPSDMKAAHQTLGRLIRRLEKEEGLPANWASHLTMLDIVHAD